MLGTGHRTALWTILALIAGGCRSASEEAARTEATPAARHALGIAAPYAAEPLPADEVEHLKTSIIARRERAWSVVARVLAPVQAGGLPAGAEVPRFLTWYSREDFTRMFRQLYLDLGADGRRARAPFAPAALDAIEGWNADMVRTLWSQQQIDDWFATLGTPDRVGSLNGLSRTLYGPSVVRHLLENYPTVATCPETSDATPSDAPGRSEDNFSLCFTSEMPSDAVVIKTTWRRSDFGLGVQSFATDAQGLAEQLAHADIGWTPDEELKHPDAQHIFTMTNDSGGHFQLAGLHIMTKEQRDWLWITLFWSPDPDKDFGEDRPEAVRALGGPWASYKMCVVTSYDEEATVDDDLRARYPTLASSLDVAVMAMAPRSWCSNPYIETGRHNNTTNCIGCHQQGGSAVATETVLNGDDPRFPDFGRQKTRVNFPADYLWSLGREPERLSGYVTEQMRFFDVNDQGGHR